MSVAPVVLALLSGCSSEQPNPQPPPTTDKWVAVGFRNVLPGKEVYILPDSIQAIWYNTIRVRVYRPDLLKPDTLRAVREDINCTTFETRDPGDQWISNNPAPGLRNKNARYRMLHQICNVADSLGLLIENPLRAGSRFEPPKRRGR